MKVRVKDTSIDKMDERLQDRTHIINHDMSNYLKIGDEYLVFGIRISIYCMYAYIYDGRHLIEIPFELLTIVDSSKSLDYELRVRDNGDIVLRPPLFFEENFIENFSEYEEKERSAFELLRMMVEGQG